MSGKKGMTQKILRGSGILNTKENNFYKYLNIPNNKDECMEWTGAKHTFGYGIFRKHILAHRFSYQHFIGGIGNGMSVLHKCDNPACVNPDHLFLGNQKDNIQDMMNKKIGKFPGSPGERHHKHKLTRKNIEEIKDKLNLGVKQKEIAKIYSIDSSQISRINTGKTWRNE